MHRAPLSSIQTLTQTLALALALALGGCATAPLATSPRAAARPLALPPSAAIAAPEDAPAGLPFRLPCGEDDLIGCTNGCADHQVEDCVTLGGMYLRGEIVSIDGERASGLLHAACDDGSARGCLRLGEAVHDGKLQGDARGETEAYRRACDAGANLGCVAAGRAYLEGRGVGVYPVHAAALFRKVCDRGNAAACVALARLHDAGEGVPRDAGRAKELFTKACKLGLDEGCLLASRTGEVLSPRE